VTGNVPILRCTSYHSWSLYHCFENLLLTIIGRTVTLTRCRILWYTTMVGKHSSLKILTKVLLREGVARSSIFTTTLRQGLTHRWCLAWTFVPAAAKGYRQFAHEQARKAALSDKAGDSSSALEDTGTGGGDKELHHYHCELTVQSLQETRIAADTGALTTAAFSALLAADSSTLAGEDVATDTEGGTDLKWSVPWLALERIAAAIEATHHVQSTLPGEGETMQANVPPAEASGPGSSTTACIYVPRKAQCCDSRGSVEYAVFRAASTASCAVGGEGPEDMEHVYGMACAYTVEDAVIKFDIAYSAPRNGETYHK
jgi:hypothetical protein